jgi:hypothetical protein
LTWEAPISGLKTSVASAVTTNLAGEVDAEAWPNW